MLNEIEIDGLGTYRLPNMWQRSRIRNVKACDRHLAALAFGLGMTLAQFKKVSVEKQNEVHRAYCRLVSSSNMSRAAA